MDVQMPEMDGLEATRQIIGALGDDRPRIVALTANAMSDDRDACLAAGMDDYLSKPLRRDELMTALDNVPEGEGPAANQEEFKRRVAELMGEPDPDFELELIETFLTDLPALVQAMTDARASEDAAGVGRAAHTLKSQATMFGADGLVEASRAVEVASAQGMPDDALIDAVLAQASAVEASVRTFA
jgi:CheY-like chemotaxis protein